jgi:hypothetical protein
MRYQIAADTTVPDFLDLPWTEPLEGWSSPRIVEVVRGISRHVVRFVRYDASIFALKEMSPQLAEKEYRLLRDLADHAVPVVEAVGVVSERPGALDAVLVTRHLDFSLPYRLLFSGHRLPDLREHLLDALAHLLVRLHVAGFFWGDCSLSNALFRRDAGALSAYLVDAETGEMHTTLSDGMRHHDVSIAVENLAGELMDVAEADSLPAGIDAVETAYEVGRRYEALWAELTREELIGHDERHRIQERLGRLHALGFDTDELELVAGEGGYLLRVNPRVVEPGYHRRRLLSLTGLDVEENQARRLLDDMLGFREEAERAAGGPLPDPIVAFRWLAEAYGPALAAIPDELRSKLAPAELYHQLLEHRWFRSEELQRCISMEEAVASYVPAVLVDAPEERMLPADGR